MKNLFNRIISLICAVTLLICVLSVCAAAENEPASFTDLQEDNLSEEQLEVTPENDQDETEAGLDETGDRSEDNDEKEPEAEPGEEDTSDESSDGPVDSVEILITKTMVLGESWEGRTRNTRLVVLKLDIEKEQTVHMIVEGKNTWANVQKSDRTEENLRKVLTDPETKRAIITWEAEEGSYLITIGPEEPNIMSNAKVTFLDDEAYAAWEEALEEETEKLAEEEIEETDPEQERSEEQDREIPEESKQEFSEEQDQDQTDKEEKVEDSEPVLEDEQESVQKEEPEQEEETILEEEQKPEQEEVEEEAKNERSVYITLTWDNENPQIGDTAHINATLTGYEGLNYTLQWQTSWDHEIWTDYHGAKECNLDITLTKELDGIYFRLVVYLEEEQE